MKFQTANQFNNIPNMHFEVCLFNVWHVDELFYSLESFNEPYSVFINNLSLNKYDKVKD